MHVPPDTPRSQPSATLNQATALQAEGVQVTTSAMGELMVDLREYGWFPRSLPSEDDDGLDSSSEESSGDGEENGGDDDEPDDENGSSSRQRSSRAAI